MINALLPLLVQAQFTRTTQASPSTMPWPSPTTPRKTEQVGSRVSIAGAIGSGIDETTGGEQPQHAFRLLFYAVISDVGDRLEKRCRGRFWLEIV